MKISTRTRLLVTALAVVAIAAPTAQTATGLTPAEAEAKGWQAVLGIGEAVDPATAAAYEAQGWKSVLGVSDRGAGDPQLAARHEAEAFRRIYGIPGIATVTPPDALAHEAESWTRVVFPETTPVQAVSAEGFDYRDAAIGAVGALGGALLFAAAMLATRRHRRLAHL